MTMGQLMEEIGDFESAIIYYKQAHTDRQADADNPAWMDLWYWVNNNLGFSLNQIGKYQEAEGYCRVAISIDHYSYNAYKNLEVSLEAQGQYKKAAWLYIKAARLSSRDTRSLTHLENILAKHGEILREIPKMNNELEKCRKAARKMQEALQNTDPKYKSDIPW